MIGALSLVAAGIVFATQGERDSASEVAEMNEGFSRKNTENDRWAQVSGEHDHVVAAFA
jgi:hypothetical protein